MKLIILFCFIIFIKSENTTFLNDMSYFLNFLDQKQNEIQYVKSNSISDHKKLLKYQQRFQQLTRELRQIQETFYNNGTWYHKILVDIDINEIRDNYFFKIIFQIILRSFKLQRKKNDNILAQMLNETMQGSAEQVYIEKRVLEFNYLQNLFYNYNISRQIAAFQQVNINLNYILGLKFELNYQELIEKVDYYFKTNIINQEILKDKQKVLDKLNDKLEKTLAYDKKYKDMDNNLQIEITKLKLKLQQKKFEPSEQPCFFYQNCKDCNMYQNCGWCATTQKCIKSIKLKPEGICDNFFYGFCPTDKCLNLNNCKTCVQSLQCKWCNSELSCMEKHQYCLEGEIMRMDVIYCDNFEQLSR